MLPASPSSDYFVRFKLAIVLQASFFALNLESKAVVLSMVLKMLTSYIKLKTYFINDKSLVYGSLSLEVWCPCRFYVLKMPPLNQLDQVSLSELGNT